MCRCLASRRQYPAQPRPELDDHIRTALARVLATRTPELRGEALSQAELVQMRANAFEAGKLAMNRAGFARLTTQYDGRGNAVEEVTFDPAGRLVPSKEGGYARWTAKYASCVRASAWKAE